MPRIREQLKELIAIKLFAFAATVVSYLRLRDFNLDGGLGAY